MAQYIKIDSQVFNADTFIAVVPTIDPLGDSSQISIATTSTHFEESSERDVNFWNITTGSAAQASALTLAINKALTANPGGRVIEVSASSDYTISSIIYKKDE
jgi:hypothetical protein